MTRIRGTTWALLGLGLLAGCADGPAEPAGPTEPTEAEAEQLVLLQEVECTVDAVAGTFDCGAARASTEGTAAEITLGGQGVYVQLTSSNVTVTDPLPVETDLLYADVTIQNLTAQAMETIRIFFHSGPTNGVTVRNADGTDTFTASGQPYHEYSFATGLLGGDAYLDPGEVSSSKKWEFKRNGATEFTFSVYVASLMLAEDGVLRWVQMSSGTSDALQAVWGTSASDIFAVGANGTILHYNGTSWSAMTSGTTDILLSVWGSASDDVWAVSPTGTVLHYNGTGWTTATTLSSQPYDVWGSSASDIFAVGASGAIEHYDGTGWSSMTSSTTNGLLGVWGTSGSDVYAVGVGGTIVHYDGTSWSTMTSNTSNDVYEVWGWSSTSVYAVGYARTLVSWNGSSWTEESTSTFDSFWGVWGGPSYLYLVGDQASDRTTTTLYDGTLVPMTSGNNTTLNDIWGTSDSDMWAVGEGGLILHGTR
jgi:hypothetical protein